MKTCTDFCPSLTAAVLLSWLALPGGLAAEESKKKASLKSGPQVGESVSAYHPLLCNGKSVGQRWCMVCTERGRGNAMVIVFVREESETARGVITAVEDATKKFKKVGGIVTFLTTKGKKSGDAEELTGGKVVYLNKAEEQQFDLIQKMAEELKIKNSSLNIYTADGPPSFRLSPEAAVTVVAVDHSGQVQYNAAMRKNELGEKKVQEIRAAIEKVYSGKS